MALKEEFEYMSFRCCYCYFFNPARKKRPPAPKLEIENKPQLSIEGPDSSESEKNSSTDIDSDQDGKTSPGGLPKHLRTLYPKDKEPSSDSERNDFDKLSDVEFKNSDNETAPMEVDNSTNEEVQPVIETKREDDKEVVKQES